MKLNVMTKIVAAAFLLIIAISCNKKDNESEEKPDKTVVEDLNCGCTPKDDATLLQVGANKTFKTIKAAAAAAKSNSVIEIDAGTYKGDVALWKQDDLVIRAVGGEVTLDANGAHYGGKAIWEITGKNVCVEGITFINAKVPDKNGAGIRHTRGDLTVVGCRFLHNEMGILTANENDMRLTVRNSEFGYGGYGDGYSHNIYVGHVGRVDISGCWFHHASRGHLIKSRAAISNIYCNLIADGTDKESSSSYNIDLPDGGNGFIVGNVIQKSPNSEQMHVLSFAKESSTYHKANRIFIAHNTVINNRVSSNNRLLNTPSSGVEIYILNNAIDNNTHYNDYLTPNADKGNIVYQANELNANRYPIASALAAWKAKLEKNIDSYIPADLKPESLSLVPKHQYDSNIKVKKLTSAPSIPGSVQIP